MARKCRYKESLYSFEFSGMALVYGHCIYICIEYRLVRCGYDCTYTHGRALDTS